jgi:hypothetical protein
MPAGFDLLAVTRVQAITETVNETLEIPGSLRFLDRTPTVPAEDGEIMGTHEAYVVSADLVADDQSATVRSGGRFTLNTAAIPNIKQGSLITQSMLKLLHRINQGGGIPNDRGIVSGYVTREMQAKIISNRIMQNRMIAGMMIDLFAYQKGGIVYSNVSWGMPSDLKFVPSTDYTIGNAGTATPIQDLQLYLSYAQQTYGEVYNRLTLSQSAFNLICGTTDFRTHAQLFTAAANSASTFPTNVGSVMRPLFEQITGLQVEVEDNVYRDEWNDASVTTGRFLPVNYAFLSNTADDNNSGTFDFANGIVTESEVGLIPGTQVIGGGFSSPQYGPVGYATIKGDLNPPNVTLWAVTRGFPRKKRVSATARIKMW